MDLMITRRFIIFENLDNTQEYHAVIQSSVVVQKFQVEFVPNSPNQGGQNKIIGKTWAYDRFTLYTSKQHEKKNNSKDPKGAGNYNTRSNDVP